jgi:hypothetical protein
MSSIQDEIAASILDEFRIRRDTRPSERAPLNVPAHDAYLKGMYALNKWTDGAMRQAIIDFNQALTADADFAPAYAALAEAHIWFYSGLGILPAAETVPHARTAVTALTSTRTRARPQGSRFDCHEPRLIDGRGTGADTRPPARPRLGARVCGMPGACAARKALRTGAD